MKINNINNLKLFIIFLFVVFNFKQLYAEPVVGRMIKIRGKKAVARFPKKVKILKKEVLKIYYRAPNDTPGQLIGTMFVKKVRKKRSYNIVYGALRKIGRIPKADFKNALVIKGTLASTKSGLSRYGRSVPARMLISGVFNYISTEEYVGNIEPQEIALNLKNTADELTTESVSPTKTSFINLCISSAFYPLGFIENLWYYNLFGVGFTFLTKVSGGKGTPPSGTETSTAMSADDTIALEEQNKFTFQHISVDLRLRYAKYVNPTFYFSTIIKFYPYDQMKITRLNHPTLTNQFPYDSNIQGYKLVGVKYNYMQLGFEQRFIFSDLFVVGGHFEYPVSQTIYFSNPDGATADTGTEGNLVAKGFSAGGYIGVKIKLFEIRFHYDYSSRGFDDGMDDVSINNHCFGGQAGITY